MKKLIDVSKYDTPFKQVAKSITLMSPAMVPPTPRSCGVYYGVSDDGPVVAKCYDAINFRPDHDLNNMFSRLSGENAKMVATSNHRYYISPFYNAGTLKDLINSDVKFTEEQVAPLILKIAELLASLIEIGIYHGELCPEHILVNINRNGKYTYGICGFGHFMLKSEEYYKEPSIKPYLDSRVINNPKETYDISCDIWSLGILTYKLVTGQFPKLEDQIVIGTDYEYLRHIPDGTISDTLNYFCSRCLFKTSKLRILPQNIKYQPFFIPKVESLGNYEIVRKTIGVGGAGNVYKANSKEDKNQLYAIKILKRQKEYNSIIMVLGEMCIFRMLKDSAYTVKLIDEFEFESEVHLVLEFYNGQDVEKYFQNYKVNLTESIEKKIKEDVKEEIEMEMCENIWQVTSNLAHALSDMHDKFIIHRDVKPANMLISLDKHTRRLSAVRLSDFGISRELMVPDGRTDTYIGTGGYMAPDVGDGYYTKPVDIWSFGRTLQFMLYGKPSDDPKLLYSVPESYKKLISDCLQREVQKRVNIKQILKSEYLNTAPCPIVKKFPKFYKRGKKVFGTDDYLVHEVIYIPTNAKLLLKQLLTYNDETKTDIMEGIKQLIMLRGSENIYKLHQSFVMNNIFYFVLEYTNGLTLDKYIEKQGKKRLNKNIILSLSYELAKAIYDIHAHKYSHDQICPSNIYIIEEEKGEGPHVKLIYNYNIQDVSGIKMLPYTKTDVYQFGEILFFMIFGTTKNYKNCYNIAISLPLFDKLGSDKELKAALNLAIKCVDPQGYVLTSSVLNDPYFKSKPHY